MQCPKTVKDLFRTIAAKWEESLDDSDDDEPRVTVDSYDALCWDSERDIIVYTPFMDPRRDQEARDYFDPADHYIITEDELRYLAEGQGYFPQLTRPTRDR